MRRSTRRATTTVTNRTAPSTTSRCQNGIVTLSYSKARGFLPAKPSSAPCPKATSSSPAGAGAGGQRVGGAPGARRAPPRVWARSPAPGIFLWTRTAIWAGALVALFTFVPNRHPLAGRWDDPSLTHDLGAVTDVWARWDSVWFLRIAEHGYDAASGAASAFYPLYPGAVALLGRALFGHYVLAGILVSLAAAFGSFLLLHRLAAERRGAEGARGALR